MGKIRIQAWTPRLRSLPLQRSQPGCAMSTEPEKNPHLGFSNTLLVLLLQLSYAHRQTHLHAPSQSIPSNIFGWADGQPLFLGQSSLPRHSFCSQLQKAAWFPLQRQRSQGGAAPAAGVDTTPQYLSDSRGAQPSGGSISPPLFSVPGKE